MNDLWTDFISSNYIQTWKANPVLISRQPNQYVKKWNEQLKSSNKQQVLEWKMNAKMLQMKDPNTIQHVTWHVVLYIYEYYKFQLINYLPCLQEINLWMD